MAHVGAFSASEALQRLEEFSPFVSTIKSFGKPILPPLLTLQIRNEIQHLRTAAVNRETVLLKRKKEKLNRSVKEKNVSKNFEDQPNFNNEGINCESKSCDCDALSAFSETCQDNFPVQNKTYVATSKLSTKDIFSTVHKNVIVCPNIRKGRQREEYSVDNDNGIKCLKCNHVESSIDSELYQSESYYLPESNNFSLGTSSVPFVSFYENKITLSDDEQSSIIAETECGSLPTVIYNQRSSTHDTDSESNATCITQSTDLEKYMCNCSADYCSSEDTINWGSKTFSQVNAGSKSDCTSSETLINTENELTPCASVIAELNHDNEDTLSTVSEIKTNVSNNDENGLNIKRAHSVDSYMKLLKSYEQNFNVKKSQSDPCHKQLHHPSSCQTENYHQNCDETVTKKSTDLFLVRSKNDFELKTDYNHDFNNDFSASEDSLCIIEPNEERSAVRRHIRRNSYTLEQPSPVLVKALEDLTCNLDIEPNSHNSTENSEPKVSRTKMAAFLKEKIDVKESLSPAKAKKLYVAGVKALTESQDLSSSKRNNSQRIEEKNKIETENCSKCYDESHDPKEISCVGINYEPPENELDNNTTMENSFVETINQDILTRTYQLIQENHKVKVQKLLEEQNKQWLKLQEDFKKAELIIYQQLNCFAQSSSSTESKQCIPENSNFDLHNALKMLPRQDESLFSEQTNAFSPLLCINEQGINLSKSFPEKCSDNIRHSTDESQNTHLKKKYIQGHLSDMVSKNLKNDAVSSESCIQENLTVNSNPEDTFAEPDIVDSCIQCHSGSDVSNTLKRTEDNSSVNDQNSKETATDVQFNDQTVNKKHSHVLPDINNHSGSLGIDSCCPNSTLSAPVLNGNVETLNIKPGCNQSESASNCIDQIRDEQESKNVCIFSLKLDGKENNLKNLPKGKFLPFATKTTSKQISALASKNKERVITNNPELMKKFEKLPAFVKGYLTRRLFKAERVQNLIKNLQDTALLIGKLSEDLTLRVDSVSQNDVEFHRQLIVQLMTTFHNVYDIFCTISVKERMNIIAESRNLLLKKNPSKPTAVAHTVPLVLPVISTPLPNKNRKLSAATLKSLERKKGKSAIDSRTYTISDFKKCKMRPHSNPTIKSHSVSPSRIYKRSVTMSPKRKTASSGRSSSCRWTMDFK